MKQKFILSLTMLMVAGTAISFGGEIPWPRVPDGKAVELKVRNVEARSNREPAADIDIRLKVDYDHQKYSFMQVLCINELWSFMVDDEVDLMDDGYIHFRDMPGTYDFVAIFTHADHDGVTIVAKEKVEISDSTPVKLDVYSATNHIQFRPVTPGGNEMTGSSDDSSELGNVYTGMIYTDIYHKDYGHLLECMAGYDAIVENGKTKYGEQEADVYINDLGPDTSLAIVQSRVGRSAEGAFVTKLVANGSDSQIVTNTADSYVRTNHVFADHKYGNSIMSSDPTILASETVGLIPVWRGEINVERQKNAMYRIAIDNADALYISSDAGEGDFQILPFIGTYDEIDAWGTLTTGRGSGVFSAPIMVAEGEVSYLHNAAVNGLWRDEWTHSQESFVPTNNAFSDYLTYRPEPGDDVEWGNSAPICVASVGYVKNGNSQLRFNFVGRNGETRTIDKRNTTFELKANGELISNEIWDAEGDFEDWRIEDGDFRDTAAEYKITISNDNVLVDGIEGHNKTTIYYDTNFSLPSPPSLRSLQFRDANGNVTDRFSSAEEGVVEFYAGDFEYVSGESWAQHWFNFVNLSDVTVEYAPYGTDEWRSLYAEEISEMERPVAYGSFYRASLEDVDAESENGWYDLRIRLTDNSDNYQVQEISPAFKIEPAQKMHKVVLDVNYDLPVYQELNGLFAYESTGTDTQTYYGLSEEEDSHVYEFNMPTGSYDFFVGANLGYDFEGYLMLTLDDVEVNGDMNLNINASSATIRTDIEHRGPNGELVVPGVNNASAAAYSMNFIHNDKAILTSGVATDHNLLTYVLTNNASSRYEMTRLDLMGTPQGALSMIIPIDFSKPVNGSTSENWQVATVPVSTTPANTEYDAYNAVHDPGYYYVYCPNMTLMNGKHFMTGGIGVFNAACSGNTVGIWQPTGYEGPFEMMAFPAGASIKGWQSEIAAQALRRTDDGLRQVGLNFTPDRTIFMSPEESPVVGPVFDAFAGELPTEPVGNCAPLMMFTPEEEYFEFTYNGRHGETMGFASDYYTIPTIEYWDNIFSKPLCDLKFYHDGELVCSDRNDFPYDADWGDGGKYRIEISTDNVLVDGQIAGFSKSVTTMDTESGSWMPPTMTSLRIMDSEGRINDRLKDTDAAYVALTGGLFGYADSYENRYVYAPFEPVECVSIEYAPYGTEEFTALNVEEIGEPVLPGFGNLFHASLSSIPQTVSDEWYDLRMTIRDSYGSEQTQTLSPAFMVAAVSGVDNISIDEIDFTNSRIYTPGGILVDEMSEPGIYLVRTSDGRTFKIAR